MFRTLTALCLALLVFSGARAGDYEDAWKLIAKKQYSEARKLLQKAQKDKATALDASLTLMYLNAYQGMESPVDGLADLLMQHPDRNAYLFASWFNDAVLGSYGKKTKERLDLLNRVLDDNALHGSLRAAAHYVKAMHFVYTNDYDKAEKEWAQVQGIGNWQLVGPFENLSGSAFNTQHGPLTGVDAKAVFKGLNNTDISWFTPSRLNREGWIATHFSIPQNTAVLYAQTFVESAQDQKVVLNAGVSGAVKVWVNDALVLSEQQERLTELDYYKNSCTLKKGFNRILVELAYTDNSTANFIVRLTDESGNALPGLNASSEPHPYTRASSEGSATSQKHFAEAYFEKKMTAESANPLSYVLLGETYLRDRRITEARKVIEKALQLSPENPLLKFELIKCLMRTENRTALLQEVDWLKENDPFCYLNYQLKVNNLISEEKYTEANDTLARWASQYAEDEVMVNNRLTILARLEKSEELINQVVKAYERYPENTRFLSMMFRVKKLVMKDPKAALKLYEKFFKSNYSFDILSELADEYKEQGRNDDYLDILKKWYVDFDYDPRFANRLSKYYFEKRDYAKALGYAQETLQISPYNADYWNNVGSIQEALGKKDEAITAYRKAIYYDRTNYDVRKKLNLLLGKPDPFKLLPDVDVYAVIKKAGIDKNHDYNYLVDEKSAIIYEEGASEEYTSFAVKINNQKGIDTWKEYYVPYNSYTQTVLIEKSEVVKANGSKVSAERDDEHLVFTGLEPGDAVYIRFRTQNYSRGRIGREFTDNFIFNSFAPSSHARYTLVAPNDFAFRHQMINSSVQPETRKEGEYTVYTWDLQNLEAIKSEPLMPPLNDVASVLHLSSIKSWEDVANWYSDISYMDLTDNFELNSLYNEIFSDKKPMSNMEKARKIYNWIVTNIHYSSVPFRQSGLVPQEISKIISTKLGDCKDLSSLFVALAAKAGVPARLVLIDTRDNGIREMVLPSMDFNHCIALANIDGKDYYLELTDANLPFGSLPPNLQGASALLIPPHGQKATSGLQNLTSLTRTPDRIVRKVNVSVDGRDEKLQMSVSRYGCLTSGWRESYATMPADKQLEEFEQSISNGYKNPLKLESLQFTGLSELNDSIGMQYAYTVKNEVVEAGSMKMIRVPFVDQVATLESISQEKRNFPLEYWNYENTDVYETVVTISLPAGQKLMEVPANASFSFKGSTYSLKYVREGEKLKVYRTAKLQRENIAPAEYEAFRKFFNDIVEAESKYIVFK